MITKDDWAKVQKMTTWFDRFKFFGDVRFRFETLYNNFDEDGGLNNGVNLYLQRFRLRVGTTVTLDDFTAGLRLASGTGQQVSTNQTESNLSSNTDLWIDQVYLNWSGSSTRWLKITMGKMPNPFYLDYTSDLMWDDDFNPEGYAEGLSFNPKPNINLFLNAAQFALNVQANAKNTFDPITSEIFFTGSSHAPWMIGEQAGVSVESASQMKSAMAVAFYDFVNVGGRDGAPLGGTQQQGNSREMTTAAPPLPPPGTLLNNYRVLDATAMLQTRVGTIPITFMGDYLRNLANTTDTGYRTGTATGNYGYQLGFIIGHAADAHSWELAYFYKLLETDATLADLVDSDFGNGGTARRGQIMWAAYNLTKFLQFKIKYFVTTAIVPNPTPNAPVPSGCYQVVNPLDPLNNPPQTGICGDINRLQVDVNMKF